MRLRRVERIRELKIRVVLCFKPVLDILVKLLVPTRGFRRVEITSTKNVQISGREIEA